MKQFFINKKVLIAPLDWGLGHASRCISLIKYLQKTGCEIIIASSGKQMSLLKKEFPGVVYIPLKGYQVNYSRYKRWMVLKILWQTPKILSSVRKENIWLKNVIRTYKVDIVISDNRFGLYSGNVPCIFITHQLYIKAPYTWLEKIIQQINYRFINRFTECWVPDAKGNLNLAGELSHPAQLPSTPVKYLGPLSRFQYTESTSREYSYLIILSGPEPQRTVFEEKVLKLLPHLEGKKMLARGKPSDENDVIVKHNCTIKNHMDTAELQQVLEKSEFVISRAGYTTIMELMAMKKKSILVPTPGQTEQEYLAQHLMMQHWCYCCNQDDDLLYHIQKATAFEYRLPQLDATDLSTIVDDFLKIYQ